MMRPSRADGPAAGPQSQWCVVLQVELGFGGAHGGGRGAEDHPGWRAGRAIFAITEAPLPRSPQKARADSGSAEQFCMLSIMPYVMLTSRAYYVRRWGVGFGERSTRRVTDQRRRAAAHKARGKPSQGRRAGRQGE